MTGRRLFWNQEEWMPGKPTTHLVRIEPAPGGARWAAII